MATAVYTYLFSLQNTGADMFAAVPLMMRKFPSLSEKDASALLMFWMENYKEIYSLYQIMAQINSESSPCTHEGCGCSE